MIKEVTNYYARLGCAEEVLQQRLRVVDVRIDLGLPPGTVFRRLDGDGPDVMWECLYETRHDYERDLATREASDRFRAERAVMHTLLSRFERHLVVLISSEPLPEQGGQVAPSQGVGDT